MSQKTRDFLIKLGEDRDLVARFQEDPHTVMREHEVPEDHQKLIVSGDKDKLKEEADLEDAHVNFLIL